MKEQIVKVLKVPFTSARPEAPYNIHATAEYEIGGEKEKEKDKKKGKEENEKSEETQSAVETKIENAPDANKITKKAPHGDGKKNANANAKQNEKKEKKPEKKKEDVKIVKEEKLESAGKIAITIYKK